MLELLARCREPLAIELDEDIRREVLEERRLEDEARARAEREMTATERASLENERREMLRREEMAVVDRVPCPDCYAPVGTFCAGLETSSHYGRAADYARRA